MKVTYDPYADAVYIYLTTKGHELYTHVIEGEDIMVDVGTGGNRVVVGMEILDASSRLDVEELKTLEFIEYGPPVSSEELLADVGAIREKEEKYQHTHNK